MRERVGNRTVQVEGATLAGGAHVVTPPGGGWTGESFYEGDAYAALPAGGSARVTVGKGEKRLVLAVVDLQPGSTAVTTFRAGDTVLGTVRSGDIGTQGDSPAPGALLPVTLPVTLPPGQQVVTATTTATGGDEARLDALMVEPLVSRLVLGGDGHGTALLRSAATTDQQTKVVGAGQRPGPGRGLRRSRPAGAGLDEQGVGRRPGHRGGRRLHHRPSVMMGRCRPSSSCRRTWSRRRPRTCTTGGAAWIGRLPEIVADLADRWALTLEPPFQPGGECSWTAPARDAAGRDLVLKVGWTHDEGVHEGEALRLWDGRGAVRLHAEHVDGETTTLLLERARPGTELGRSLPEEEQDVVVAGLLRGLWAEPPAGHALPAAGRDVRGLGPRARGAPRPPARPRHRPGRVSRSGAACRPPPTASVLLLTDLHAGNILAAEREPWLVIDPKPYVGDPAYDPLQHLLNCLDRLRADPVGLADRMADLCEVDRERFRLWLFARCVGRVAVVAGAGADRRRARALTRRSGALGQAGERHAAAAPPGGGDRGVGQPVDGLPPQLAVEARHRVGPDRGEPFLEQGEQRDARRRRCVTGDGQRVRRGAARPGAPPGR